jgi:hypothetical protein
LIALLTVPNTGTWFLQNLIASSPDVVKTVNQNQCYFGVMRREINRHNFKYEPKCNIDHVLYQRHITGKQTHGEIDLLAIGHRAVIPMRDPLSSLISRKHRNPQVPMYEHVDAFEYCATSPWINNSFVFPIDTPSFKGSAYHRLDMARRMFEHLKIREPANLVSWAKDNEPKNSMGGYEQKDAYACGDLGCATSCCVGEFEYLKSKRDVLVPWLIDLGYEDLIWWE